MHEVEHQTKWKERLAIDEWNKIESKLPRLLSFGSLNHPMCTNCSLENGHSPKLHLFKKQVENNYEARSS